MGLVQTDRHRAQVFLARRIVGTGVDVGAGECEHRQVIADAQGSHGLVAARAEAVPAGLLEGCQVQFESRLQAHFLGEDVNELLGSDQVRAGRDLANSSGVVDRQPAAPDRRHPDEAQSARNHEREVTLRSEWIPRAWIVPGSSNGSATLEVDLKARPAQIGPVGHVPQPLHSLPPSQLVGHSGGSPFALLTSTTGTARLKPLSSNSPIGVPSATGSAA